MFVSLKRELRCRKFFMFLPAPLTILSDLHKYVPRIDAISFCGLFHCMYVCVSACVCPCIGPRGLPTNWTGTPLTIPPSTLYAPKLPRHGRKSIVREEEIRFEENSFWTIVKIPWLGVLSWPGKVPELGPQMLRSYLLRFLHEELNCCNIGLGGL